MSKSMKANLLLVLTALIWGVAFVAQDVAADALPPFTFNALRMAVGAAALFPVVWLQDRKSGEYRLCTVGIVNKKLTSFISISSHNYSLPFSSIRSVRASSQSPSNSSIIPLSQAAASFASMGISATS